MNNYCKDYLVHSWGKSPERKRLEKIYNANYYSINKDRWKINKAKRLSGIKNNQKLKSDIEEIYLAPTSLYDDGEFYKYSEETFDATANAVGKGLAKLKTVPKKVINAVKSIFKKTVIDLPKNVVDVGKKACMTLKDTAFIKTIKESIAIIKESGEMYKNT